MKFDIDFEYDPTINLYYSLEPFFEEFENCPILILY